MKSICLQLLLYVSVATPQERQEFREYWRYQRSQFIKRHIVDDAPQSVIDLERELDERERRDEE